MKREKRVLGEHWRPWACLHFHTRFRSRCYLRHARVFVPGASSCSAIRPVNPRARQVPVPPPPAIKNNSGAFQVIVNPRTTNVATLSEWLRSRGRTGVMPATPICSGGLGRNRNNDNCKDERSFDRNHFGCERCRWTVKLIYAKRSIESSFYTSRN